MTTILKPSCDRKTRFRKSQKNTYGLTPGRAGTCPHSTIGEGGCSHVPKGRKLPLCYVHGVMSAYKNVAGVLHHNTYVIQTASYEQRVALLKQEFSRFQKLELKQQEPKLFYRLHWSGDIYDENYANALIEAMNAFPDIKFWNYTRSFRRGALLASEVPHLMQYLSLDPVNMEEGIEVWLEHAHLPNLVLCYMAATNDFNTRYAALLKAHPGWPAKLATMVPCPADTKNIPVDGACARCKRCLRGGFVWFKT